MFELGQKKIVFYVETYHSVQEADSQNMLSENLSLGLQKKSLQQQLRFENVVEQYCVCMWIGSSGTQ